MAATERQSFSAAISGETIRTITSSRVVQGVVSGLWGFIQTSLIRNCPSLQTCLPSDKHGRFIGGHCDPVTAKPRGDGEFVEKEKLPRTRAGV